MELWDIFMKNFNRKNMLYLIYKKVCKTEKSTCIMYPVVII